MPSMTKACHFCGAVGTHGALTPASSWRFGACLWRSFVPGPAEQCSCGLLLKLAATHSQVWADETLGLALSLHLMLAMRAPLCHNIQAQMPFRWLCLMRSQAATVVTIELQHLSLYSCGVWDASASYASCALYGLADSNARAPSSSASDVALHA